MRWVNEVDVEQYKKKFIWWPTKLKGCKQFVWIWWEYMLVKSTSWGDGSPIRYFKNLDGSEIKLS